MEMLSNASKYAINAVLFLALDAHKDRKIGVKEIAAGIDVPVAFLAKLLQNLSRKGVVSSTKGPNGGFYLTEENRLQKLLVVIDHIDGLSKRMCTRAFKLQQRKTLSYAHPCSTS